MAFNAYTFTFDGSPCEEYGLMLYDFDGPGQTTGAFASAVSIREDRIARRFTPLHYGATLHTPLEFTLTMGCMPEAIDRGHYLDRWDLEVIGAWLTGHTQYKWLTIGQPDLENVRFRCLISELSFQTVNWLPWALTAKVRCDGPYAYTYPERYSFSVSGGREVHILSRSTHNGPYYPQLHLDLPRGGDFTVANRSEGGRAFTLALSGRDGLPAIGSSQQIDIDCENGVITTGLSDLNLYPYCNFQFPRLIRGDNFLTLTGEGEVTFTCSFPVNVGG